MNEPIATDPSAAAPRRRSWRQSLLLSLVALLVLGGAGWSIWASVGNEIQTAATQIRQEWNKPKPPTPEEITKAQEARENRPIGDDEPAYWSEVALFRAGPARPRPVVVFRRGAWTGSDDTGSLRGLLMRELVRQGLILATREATAAVVRDRAAGDPDEPGTPDAIWRLGSLIQSNVRRRPDDPLGARITLVEGVGPTRRVILSRRLDVVAQQIPNYGRIVLRVEQMIPGDFRAALAAWKLPPSQSPTTPDAPDALPGGVEEKLRSLSEIDQFAAIRTLHDEVRQRGGSPTRWQALARGYGMLGSLTEPLATAGHAVFKARALLYAQRAATAENNSPHALRAQAVAESLSGLTQEAKHGIMSADKADGGKGATPRDEAIRAFLALNPEALGKLAERSPDDLLPLYLHAITALRVFERTGEIDQVCRNEIVQAQDQVLAKVPDCYRAIDNLCEASGVSNLHRATLLGMTAFAEATSRRVAALPGIPPAVVERAQHDTAGPDEVALRQALDDAAATDPNDLTWGPLAQILRETRFWQVCRRIHFESIPLGSSASEFANGARPMLADHPNREILDLHTGELDQVHGAKLIRRLDLDGMELKNWYAMMFAVRMYDKKLSDECWRRANDQADLGLVVNVERMLRSRRENQRTQTAKDLLQIDPGSPAARAGITATDWAAAAPKVAEWEREQPWNTPLKVEIGFQLLKEKRYAEAQERFETALGRSPEAWIFAGLARAYRERNQTEEYLRAAQVMLAQPDQGLDHASVCEGLAKYLMSQGQVDLAWPWAERGAQSWANWAMETASRCAEMRRDWSNAEAWVSRQSQRYPDQWLAWLGWSLRTGHGHVPQAAALVWRQWDAGRQGRDADQDSLIAYFALVTDRPDVTRAIAEKHLVDQPAGGGNSRLLLAAALDRLGDRKARDEALDRLLAEPKPIGPRTVRILTLLVDWDRHRDVQKLADILPQVEAILGEIPPKLRTNSEAVVGLILSMLGQPAEAVSFLKRADVAATALGLRLVVRHLLADHKEPLADFFLNPPTPRSGANPDEPVEF